MVRTAIRATALLMVLAAVASLHARAETKTLGRCGRGFLEEVDGSKVLHVKGTPYEMGFQQGALLKDDIRELVRFLFDVKARELKIDVAGLKLKPDAKVIIRAIAEGQRKFVPARYFEELQGVADGSGLALDEIIVANFIPEMFHCSGFALGGSATKDGTLYHGRILDYGCDWRLQDHAVLTVAEPDGAIPFVNVTYAGFIGSVTGMNAARISVGEMGGGGRGHWAGVPMAILVRMALEEADSLDKAIAVFRDHPRTCEYYYVIADGETGKGVGMEAAWDRFGVIGMGDAHPRLPHAVTDAVLLSAGDRYEELARRVQAGHGRFDADSARALMDRPVAMKSNLHSVLFETGSTKFWVANASKDGQPAASQPYHAFQLTELLAHRPEASAPEVAAAVAPAPATAPAPASRKIDLRTAEGAGSVRGRWRYADAKVVEVEGKAADGKPNRTYNIVPKAEKPNFDDGAWEAVDPATLGKPRGGGQVCFGWYRLTCTLPEGVEGKRVFFETTVDDYGEIWVDGKLPYKVGQSGGTVVAGFNVPNRVEVPDPKPGKPCVIAIFAINGPISVAPGNRLFLKDTFFEIVDR